MAVARKVMHQLTKEAEILVGTPIEHYLGTLIRVHGSALHDVSVPVEGMITLGEDGLLVDALGLNPRVQNDLISWDETTPFVAGSFYFVPWSQLMSATAFSHPNVGDAAVMLEHCDGDVTYLQVDDEGTAESLADSAMDLCAGQPNFFSNTDLRFEIMEHLQLNPLVESDEIREALTHAGWVDIEESHIDAILNDDQLPTYFYAHLWFVDQEADLDEFEEDSLTWLIVAALQEEPDTAQGLLDRLTIAGWFIEGVDEVYDVLYHPSVPVFKRVRAWYFDENTEGEHS